MNKQQQDKIQICLVVNAIVKFNLYPPEESPEWSQNFADYALMIDDLFPDPIMNSYYRHKILKEFCAASTAKTVVDKISIYDNISVLTDLPIQALAGSNLPKMDPNSLTGRCLFAFFNSPLVRTNVPHDLVDIVEEWQDFFNSPEPCYLWEDKACFKPWTVNKVAAALCLELKKPESNELALSSLYALATILNRKDIISILNEHQITTENLNEEMQGMFQEFVFGEIVDPESENEIVEASPYII